MGRVLKRHLGDSDDRLPIYPGGVGLRVNTRPLRGDVVETQM